jgi:serine/threonine protein kinase
MLGTLLGNYRVVDQLATGGMGLVYVGHHEALERPVVMKVLRPELCNDADRVQRFFHEARAVTAVRSPGIVQVLDFGLTSDHRAYVVMELLEGEPLAARLQTRRLDHAGCCRLGRQVANVLQAAHAAGIIHRDLKPASLFLVPDPEVAGGERIKVLDFGIARLAAEARSTGAATRTGLRLGTPHYMSPEQCRSASAADARSDIYSLGCILFEIACGRPPFVFTGFGDLVDAHLHEPPPHPSQLAPGVPPGLSALIEQMLAKHPDSRPQTMAAVGQALDDVLRSLDPDAVPVSAPLIGGGRRSPLPGLPPAYPVAPSDTPPEVAPPAAPELAPSAAPELALPAGQPSSGLPEFSSIAATPRRWAGALALRRGRARRPIYVVGAVALVGAVVAISLITGPSGSPDRAASYAEVAEAHASNAAASAAAGRVSADCRRFQADRNWTLLAQCAVQLRPLDPKLAAELATRAAQEVSSAPHVVAARAALDDGELKRAKAEVDQVWPDSVDSAELQSAYAAAEAQEIDALSTQLDSVKDASCAAYNQLLGEYSASDPPGVVQEAIRRVSCKVLRK